MMKPIAFSKTSPSLALDGWIDTYWIAHHHEPHALFVPIVPDGCVDIVYKNGELYLVGTMEVAAIKEIVPEQKLFGIRFAPACINAFVRGNVSHWNDAVILLREIDAPLDDALKAIFATDHEPFLALNALFEARISSSCVDPKILFAVEKLIENHGNLDIKTLCDMTHLTQRQLERQFLRHVGLTPKKFARVIRFFDTHKHLSKEGLDDLCLKVLEKGYYDQAHFNREYKNFVGVNPSHELMSIFYKTNKL